MWVVCGDLVLVPGWCLGFLLGFGYFGRCLGFEDLVFGFRWLSSYLGAWNLLQS